MLDIMTCNNYLILIGNKMNISKDVHIAVSSYIKDHFKDQMSDSQLKALAQRALESLGRSPHFLKIKKAFKLGDKNAFNGKIKKVLDSLIVTPASPWTPQIVTKNDRQKLIFDILRGERPTIKEIAKDMSLVSAILWKPNNDLLDDARALLQDILLDLYRQLSTEPLDKNEQFHMEMIIGEVLSIYPFIKPKIGEELKVPVCIHGEWKLVSYKTDRIELTPHWMGSPLVAYGLYSTNSSASPLLLFKGTTYPTDDGASLSLMTDFNPFGSVGSYGFGIGKNKIEEWLNQHTKNSQAIVYGKSLGGAQAWRSALNFPEKISKVMAFGAPGFYPWELRKLKKTLNAHPNLDINIFCQKNDPVPYSDLAAKKGVKYFEVLGEIIQDNLVMAHVDFYSFQKNSSILKLKEPTIQSTWKRVALTATRLAGTLFFPVLLVIHILKTTVDHLCNLAFSKIKGTADAIDLINANDNRQ